MQIQKSPKRTIFSSGRLELLQLNIRCPAVGNANTNWFDSLGVGSECHIIAKSAVKKSAIVITLSLSLRKML